jgi:hypothetical protein
VRVTQTRIVFDFFEFRDFVGVPDRVGIVNIDVVFIVVVLKLPKSVSRLGW